MPKLVFQTVLNVIIMKNYLVILIHFMTKKVWAVNQNRGTELINYIVYNINVEKQNIPVK